METAEIKSCRTCVYELDEAHKEPCSSCDATGSNYERYNNMSTVTVHDNVNSPRHYTHGKFEVIDVLEDWNLNFRLANAVKYIARHKHKGKPIEDLKKAVWYIQREIEKYGKPC